jgi:hypothetical protein
MRSVVVRSVALFGSFITSRGSTDVTSFATDFTNLVVPLSVGTPPQQVFVGVAFNSRKSWLYASGECPPFVDCYTSSSSESFVFGGSDRSVLLAGAHLTGFSCEEEFNLGNGINSFSEFVHTVHHRGHSMTGRDTAGELALGPTSDIAANHVIELRGDYDSPGRYARGLQRWRLVVDPVQRPLGPGQMEVYFNIDKRRDSWKFTSKLYVAGKELYRRLFITFIPNHDDIIIPPPDRAFLLNHLIPESVKYLVDQSGRLFLECSVSGGPAKTQQLKQLSLRTLPHGNRFVNILSKALQYSGILNTQSVISEDGSRFCPTRMVFQNRNNEWVFGFPLLASVQSVYLDGHGSRATFRMIASNEQRPESVVTPITPLVFDRLGFKSLPRFSIPEIRIDGSDVRSTTSIRFSSMWTQVGKRSENDLVLYSANTEGNADSTEFRYVFIRMRNSLLTRTDDTKNVRELEGLYHIPKLGTSMSDSRTEGTVVSFDFKAASNPDESKYVVSIEEDMRTLQVVMRKSEGLIDLKHFEISAAQVQGEQNDEDYCRICMNSIETGAHKQELPCGDIFHPECIERWLATKRSCPLCRFKVELKPMQKPFLLKKITTPEPEDSEEED